MTVTGSRGGGRKSKGDRRYIASRVPLKYSEDLDRAVKCSGLSLTDFVAAAVIKSVETFDFKKHEATEQERLTIEKAS